MKELICTDPWKATIIVIVWGLLILFVALLCFGAYQMTKARWEWMKKWSEDYSLLERIEYTFRAYYVIGGIIGFVFAIRYLLPVIFC